MLNHVGDAESGHYYSYIKTHDHLWHEFNDTKITPFDFNDIS